MAGTRVNNVDDCPVDSGLSSLSEYILLDCIHNVYHLLIETRVYIRGKIDFLNHVPSVREALTNINDDVEEILLLLLLLVVYSKTKKQRNAKRDA